MARILLVEDEEKLARFVELELTHEGYQVDKAFDGRTGLEKAEGGDYDLLLLDIMLPGLNGLEVLRRAREAAPGTRLVVLSNYATPEMRRRCLALGADRVFDKSAELDELIAYCETLSDTARP